jgi:hypothetical protein
MILSLSHEEGPVTTGPSFFVIYEFVVISLSYATIMEPGRWPVAPEIMVSPAGGARDQTWIVCELSGTVEERA